jgi:hypothetical protein
VFLLDASMSTLESPLIFLIVSFSGGDCGGPLPTGRSCMFSIEDYSGYSYI